MTFSESWNVISARIRGLSESAHLYSQLLMGNSSGSYGVGNNIAEQCARLLGAIGEFQAAFGSLLPADASACLAEFLSGHPAKVIGATGGAREGKASILFLLAFEPEM